MIKTLAEIIGKKRVYRVSFNLETCVRGEDYYYSDYSTFVLADNLEQAMAIFRQNFDAWVDDLEKKYDYDKPSKRETLDITDVKIENDVRMYYEMMTEKAE